MTQEAKQIEILNLEAKSEGKSIFTLKQWLERREKNINESKIQNGHY